MTTALEIYARVEKEIAQPIERVWAIVSAFGGLERWAPGVTACTVEGAGVGAIRTVVLGDRDARERLELLDPVAHKIRYHILPPHQMPADNVHGEMTLTPIGGDRTRIVWQSEANDFRVPPEQIGARIEAFYAGSIEGLVRLLGD